MKKIQQYIKKNWDKLPKSKFDDKELVIFLEDYNDDGGWGHHSYSGYGADNEGKIFWAYSSGCSCDGSCGVEHKEEIKTFKVKDGLEVEDFDPKGIDFDKLQANFSSY